MRSAIIRPTASFGPPAGNGTMNVMGREGYDCPLAILGRDDSAVAPVARRKNWRRTRSMVSSRQLGQTEAGQSVLKISREDVRPADGQSLLPFEHGTSASALAANNLTLHHLGQYREGVA